MTVLWWLFLLAVNVWSMQSLLRSDKRIREMKEKLNVEMPFRYRFISFVGKLAAATGIACMTVKLLGV